MRKLLCDRKSAHWAYGLGLAARLKMQLENLPTVVCPFTGYWWQRYWRDAFEGRPFIYKAEGNAQTQEA